MKHTQIYLLILFVFASISLFGQRRTNTDYLEAKQSVVVGQGTKTTDAILDIISTDKGAILPRMTETQRDNLSDVAGLIVFNTTAGTYQYNTGSGWVDFGSGSGGGVEKVASNGSILDMSKSAGDLIFSYDVGAWYIVQADSIAGYEVDSVAVIPVSSGYAVLQELREKRRVDVRKLGIESGTNYTNAQLQIVNKYPHGVSFPNDTFSFRNWQIINQDNLDIHFDNTTLVFPSGTSISVEDTIDTDGFELPQIAIVNVKDISLTGKLLVDHEYNSPSFSLPTSGGAAGSVNISAGVDYQEYGDIVISGITTKGSYFIPLKIESPQTWVPYDSLMWRNITFTDCHSDMSAALIQTRVVANNIRVYDCTMEIDRDKSIFGTSDETKAFGFSLDVNSTAKVNLHVSGLYSKYGGAGFYQNIHNVQLENIVSEDWGYFPLSSGNKGDIVTPAWKAANPGDWDAATMIEYAGGQAIKIDNYYYRPDRVFIIENFEARNTNQHPGTYSEVLLVEAGNENLILTDSYIDDVVRYSSIPGNPEGVARKGLIENVVFNENAVLRINRGTTVNNCVFRDTVSLVSSGKQYEIDTTSTWKAGLFVTTTDEFQRVRINDCVFTNRGISALGDTRIEVNNCSFEGYSEINCGSTLTTRSELIVKNSYGGRYRQSLTGTSDSLEIRFINHDRLGMNSTTFNNLQSSPYCEVRNCIIINYDSTEVADLQTSIDATLTENSRLPSDLKAKSITLNSGSGPWQNYQTARGSSISSGAYVIETDIPFTSGAYFMIKVNFYRYYVTATRQIGSITAGSYLASVPDFYNEQAISTGEWGGTDKIRFAANADNEVVIIIGETSDSYGSYACHFVFDDLKFSDINYVPNVSNWTFKNDTDISEYTVKQTVTGTQLKTDQNGDLYLNAAKTVGVITGTGSPESSVTASVGALYIRTDGGTSTTLYVKESGTGNTGWVAK
jgi:hypothetical protein